MTENAQPKAPTHFIWQVIGDGEKSRWNRIGAGWANKDGKGVSLKFDAYPTSGRIAIRTAKNAAEGSRP